MKADEDNFVDDDDDDDDDDDYFDYEDDDEYDDEEEEEYDDDYYDEDFFKGEVSDFKKIRTIKILKKKFMKSIYKISTHLYICQH